MDLDRLREFVCVAQNGSLTASAKKLGCSAATLSARLKSFERVEGISLFERNGRTLALTEEGERLLPNAISIVRDYEKTLDELHHVQSHSYHSLRIVIAQVGMIMPLKLGPFLDWLCVTNAGMDVGLFDDTFFSIADGIASGEADVVFASVPEGFRIEGLEKRLVSNNSHCVLLPRGHRLASKSLVSMSELDGETFLLYPPTATGTIRTFQRDNVETAGISHVFYEVTCAPTFYPMFVPMGKGIALLPHIVPVQPPNSVMAMVVDVPRPYETCFFFDPTSTKAEVRNFIQDYSLFLEKDRGHGHR